MERLLPTIILSAIGVYLIYRVIRLFNKLIMLKNNIEKNFANIDVVLRQRVDEIPNIIATVKGAMAHETALFNQLVEMRTKFLSSHDPEEKIDLTNRGGNHVKHLFAVAEKYPELKSNQNFMALQTRITTLENIISDRRELYNESVTMYNIGIAEFPTLVIAKMMRFRARKLLTQPHGEEKR